MNMYMHGVYRVDGGRTWAYSPSIPEYEFPRVNLGLVRIIRVHITVWIKVKRAVEHFFIVRDGPVNVCMLNILLIRAKKRDMPYVCD